jgi:hypothetical protein
MVDDAQWLDQASAQALAFVARRLLAERIAIVFSIREAGDVSELTGLPELVVGGLADDEARRLLESAMPGRLDEQVRDQIIAETHGNPLALLELPRGLTPAEVAGGFGLSNVMPLATRIEQSFLRRLESLPPETQQLLLVAAAEPVGDVTLLWRAAEQLGIRGSASGPAEEAALIELGIRVRFRHPLVRSAVYWAASAQDRQRVHRALAGATDPEADPDRRAWHRAHAAAGLDGQIGSAVRRAGVVTLSERDLVIPRLVGVAGLRPASAALNVSGQGGSALAVPLRDALTAAADPLHGYAHAWLVRPAKAWPRPPSCSLWASDERRRDQPLNAGVRSNHGP